MNKHRSPQPDNTTAQRAGGWVPTGWIHTMLAFSLLLGFLGLSLQSSSGIEVVSEAPAIGAQVFDEVPDDALNPNSFVAAHAPKVDASTEPPKVETSPPPAAEPAPPAADPDPVAPSDPVDPVVGPQVAPAPPAIPQPPAAEVQGVPPASAPQRITYGSAGIDVAVYPMGIDQAAQESQSIVPPFTLDGYWLSPFGAPGYGSANTTYIVGHSWEDRDAPFNRLSSHAMPGDTFAVTTGTGTLTYQVDSVTTYLKSTLKDSDIWSVQPNRIVLISCYTEDPWGKNVVVIASPVP